LTDPHKYNKLWSEPICCLQAGGTDPDTPLQKLTFFSVHSMAELIEKEIVFTLLPLLALSFNSISIIANCTR
jgi:hypothetical protein